MGDFVKRSLTTDDPRIARWVAALAERGATEHRRTDGGSVPPEVLRFIAEARQFGATASNEPAAALEPVVEEWMGTTEAADLLGVSPVTVRAWAAKGHLWPRRRGRLIEVDAVEVRKLAKASEAVGKGRRAA